MRSVLLRRAIVPFAFALVVGTVGAGNAHTYTKFYDEGQWQVTEIDPICFASQAFQDGQTPGGQGRGRVQDGHGRWNDEPPALYFNVGDCDADQYDFSLVWNDPCNNYTIGKPSNGIFWQTLTGQYERFAGLTFRCDEDNGLNKVRQYTIVFNAALNWHLGTSMPGLTEVDLYSVATHEAGHATGWDGHFTGTTECTGFNDSQTMCGPTYTGRAWSRSLESHDQHTFDNAY